MERKVINVALMREKSISKMVVVKGSKEVIKGGN